MKSKASRKASQKKVKPEVKAPSILKVKTSIKVGRVNIHEHRT